jgi:SAM-dependent methyltransferase
MRKQKDIFMDGGEGDAWFTRNLGKLGEHDPVTDAIVNAGIKPKYALEIGCANGWRLDKLRSIFNCGIMGVEPSMKAGIAAAQLRVPVHQMTASCIPVSSHGYDLIIYGFCLYLTDPDDWLLIASEGDRALAPGGHLVIHDFAPPEVWTTRRYEHRDGVWSHHFDFARLWLAHPNYMRVSAKDVGDERVTILRKSKTP